MGGLVAAWVTHWLLVARPYAHTRKWVHARILCKLNIIERIPLHKQNSKYIFCGRKREDEGRWWMKPSWGAWGQLGIHTPWWPCTQSVAPVCTKDMYRLQLERAILPDKLFLWVCQRFLIDEVNVSILAWASVEPSWKSKHCVMTRTNLQYCNEAPFYDPCFIFVLQSVLWVDQEVKSLCGERSHEKFDLKEAQTPAFVSNFRWSFSIFDFERFVITVTLLALLPSFTIECDRWSTGMAEITLGEAIKTPLPRKNVQIGKSRDRFPGI